jgi:hypothetical protein
MLERPPPRVSVLPTPSREAANISSNLRRSRRDRFARYRARRRNGRMAVTVELGPEVLDMLIRAHWLEERHAGDRMAIGQAIARMLAEAAR